MLAAMIFGAVTAYWELKVLPGISLGRLGALRDFVASWRTPALTEPTEMLKGQEGVALTPLNPTGHVEIKKKRYLAQCMRAAVAEGQKVQVTEVGVHGLKVMPVELKK